MLLSKNIFTGIRSIKKKKKHNTVKKKPLLVGTIGLPVFFTRYLYNFRNLYSLFFSIQIVEESRKKMGKKIKKKKKKKINLIIIFFQILTLCN